MTSRTRVNFASLIALASLPLCRPALAAEVARADEPVSQALAFEAVNTGEVWRNASGGIARGGAYLDNLDLVLSLDGQAAFEVTGLSAYAHVLYNNGQSFSERRVGDLHVVSNIETNQALRLYELWIDYRFRAARRAASLRVGLYDLNSEFDASDVASLFINATQGIGIDFAQSGKNGPSIFPVTSLAARLRWEPAPGWITQLAVLDGVPGDPDHPKRTAIKLSSRDGALAIMEVGRQVDQRRVAAGYWSYTAKFDDLQAITVDGTPAQRSDNAGLYVLAEGRLWKGSNERQLSGALRWGSANADINAIRQHARAALVLEGASGSARGGQLGVGIAWSKLSTSARRAAAAAGVPFGQDEISLELTYRRPILDWLTLQPDLQYVIHPGAATNLRNAWVVGLRFEVSQSTD